MILLNILILLSGIFLMSVASESEKTPKENLPPSQAEQKTESYKHKAAAEDDLPAAEYVRENAANPINQTEGNKTPGNWYDFIGQSTMPNWLVNAGWMLASLVGWWTLGVLKDQVRANDKSAEAAIASADLAKTFLNVSERAWVWIKFDKMYVLGDDSFNFKIMNTGKTPGHIKFCQLVEFTVVDKETPLPYEPKPIPTGEMGVLCTIFPQQDDMEQSWDVRIDKNDIGAIASKVKRLTICGFILYDDIFGERHITNFYRVFEGTHSAFKGVFIIPPDARAGQNETT